MFVFESYIKKPNKIIDDLTTLDGNYQEYFVHIDDFKMMNQFICDIDKDYIEGAICIKYNEMILMNFNEWDLVDQLWAYFINLIEDYNENEVAETYFPDQPIKIEIKAINQDLLLLKIDSDKNVKMSLPKSEFFNSILNGAENFFKKMSDYLNDKTEYWGELERIYALKSQY